MSYTINPNAKNKWARNAENTMDLSLETDASSVYLDNGRTLEQEIGEGSMVSNVATVDSAMSKVIDGTLDGAYESCVFKGQTLVNLIGEKREYINRNSRLYGWEFMLPYNLTSGKTYLAIFDVSGTIDKSNSKVYLMDNGFESTSGNSDSTIPTFSLGHNVVKCIATNDIHKVLRIRTNYNENEKFTVSNVMLIEYQEGMENWDIPFFEGLCDVKMPILHNVGKNLFDGELEMGGYTGSSGSPYDSDIRVRSVEKIFLSEETYTLSSDGATKTIFSIYDLNGVFKKEFVSNSSSCTITLNEDCMVHICVENEKLLNSHIQLEQGSNATPYEDYKINILRTPEIVTLRSLPNGVRDELNLNTGEYIKRIGEIVLNGSEDWEYTNETFRSGIIRNKVFEQVTASDREKIYLICDKYKSITYSAPWNSGEFIALHISKQIVIRDERFANTQDWKQHLSQNPLTVQYELAKPITTIVEPLTIPFAYENGHIILESGYEGQSLLPTLEYSTVVNKTGLIENVAKTIQRQEKQLTMLEKMLIQNIINLDYNNTLLTLKNEMEEML